MINISEVTERHDADELKKIIFEHVKATGSELGKTILDDFEAWLPKFKKIIPKDYQKMIDAIAQFERSGASSSDATLQAFYALTQKA